MRPSPDRRLRIAAAVAAVCALAVYAPAEKYLATHSIYTTSSHKGLLTELGKRELQSCGWAIVSRLHGTL
ncbi:hypothetical protein ACI65C_000510 [Semiaphis heraclei]